MALATVAASRFFSADFYFGSHRASLSAMPVPFKDEHENRTRVSLPCSLRLATDPPRVSEEWAEGCLKVGSEGEERRVVVGRIVDCEQMFLLADESSPHAYALMNIRLVKALLGRKVRITGALQSPHVLAVETVKELN